MTVHKTQAVVPMETVPFGYHTLLSTRPLLGLFGQAGAALKPATVQHNTAGLGGHPLHKTVLGGTLTFFGLIGSFWHIFYCTLCLRWYDLRLPASIRLAAPRKIDNI